jgi:type II secretory pathway component PulC
VRFFCVLSLLLAACGGSAPPPERNETSSTPAHRAAVFTPAPAAPEPADGSSTIARAELDAVLDAGLGRFLQGVETEPVLEGGRFAGFRLVSLYPDDPRLAGSEPRAGDVVVRVNGQSIERPEQAMRVWEELRVASELAIEYRRDGEAREVRYPIVD